MAVLEATMTSKTRENMKKSPKNNKKEAKKVLLVAQELKLARVLAGNNKTARDRALKSLKKWLQHRANTIPFTEEDFLRLWKGLFYSMWMSDKPLVQEECAENIANLVHSLPCDTAILFYKCGMITLMNEWFGVDQLRLDKFLMFVRRLLRQVLFVVKTQHWSRDSVFKFTQCLSETILEPHSQKPLGLVLHFIEIYLEELAKVTDGELPPQMMTHFLAPFIKQLAFSDDERIISHLRKHVFVYLIRQSDLGLEYDEKYKAWRSLGFPGSIDCMKKVGENGDEEEVPEEEERVFKEGEKVFDPRAGHVNVDLPQLRFHSKAIARALSELKFDKSTNSKSRKCLSELVEHFKKLASGIYPLGVKKVKVDSRTYDTNVRKAVNRLVKFDKKIKGKKNKKRKIDSDQMIELRGGKKIKFDEELERRIEQDVQVYLKLKKKRKNEENGETPPEKLRKKEPLQEIESIFRRNSGTWLVTRTAQNKEVKIIYPKNTWVDQGSAAEIEMMKVLTPDSSSFDLDEENELNKVMFPKTKWDSPIDTSIEKITNSLKKSRLSLPSELLKNPFATATPAKKVKINTKLNRSQDMYEHQAQILSSPAIPYDASKKPAKPLLKTPIKKSPINPFSLN